MDIRFRLVITEDMLDEKKLKKGIRGLVEDMTYEGLYIFWAKCHMPQKVLKKYKENNKRRGG